MPKFLERLDLKKGGWPNYKYFEELRKELGVDFGHVAVTSDGHYVLDLSALKRHVRNLTLSKGNSKEDLYEKVARRMGTFVCERCFNEELMGNNESPQALALHAKTQGWLIVPPEGKREQWFFEAFQVVGPKCAAEARGDCRPG